MMKEISIRLFEKTELNNLLNYLRVKKKTKKSGKDNSKMGKKWASSSTARYYKTQYA